MNKAHWWIAATATSVVVVGTVVGGIVVADPGPLTVDPPEPLPLVAAIATPLGGTGAQIDEQALSVQLHEILNAPGADAIDASVRDVATGATLFQASTEGALVPASSTKVLTAVSAARQLLPTATVETRLYQPEPGVVVIASDGDVWLTPQRLEQLLAAVTGPVDTVRVVTGTWWAPRWVDSWHSEDIDGGYITYLEPLMFHGGRLGGDSGDLPRSHEPALDVARYAATHLGAPHAELVVAEPVGQKILATTQSPTLRERLREMLQQSDNVAAEAIARELNPGDPVAGVLAGLGGIDTTGVHLVDASGLSTSNRIPAAVLAAAVAAEPELLPGLPVAGGTGTLADRFEGLGGAGWVRAKTGTLTGVVSLTGITTTASGRVLSFGIVVHEKDVLAGRARLDAFASVLRAQP